MWEPGGKAAIGLTALVAVSAAVAIARPGAEDAQARTKLTCRSGATVFKAGKTRIFKISRPSEEAFYGCSARLRRPRHIVTNDMLGYTDGPAAGPRFGRRVLFSDPWADEVTGGERLGWWDERTGRRRWGDFVAEFKPSRYIDAVSVAPDGAIAVAYREEPEGPEPAPVAAHAQWIAVMCLGKVQLAQPHVIAQLDRRTARVTALLMTRKTVSWRTKQGQRGSVPRACRMD